MTDVGFEISLRHEAQAHKPLPLPPPIKTQNKQILKQKELQLSGIGGKMKWGGGASANQELGNKKSLKIKESNVTKA